MKSARLLLVTLLAAALLAAGPTSFEPLPLGASDAPAKGPAKKKKSSSKKKKSSKKKAKKKSKKRKSRKKKRRSSDDRKLTRLCMKRLTVECATFMKYAVFINGSSSFKQTSTFGMTTTGTYRYATIAGNASVSRRHDPLAPAAQRTGPEQYSISGDGVGLLTVAEQTRTSPGNSTCSGWSETTTQTNGIGAGVTASLHARLDAGGNAAELPSWRVQRIATGSGHRSHTGQTCTDSQGNTFEAIKPFSGPSSPPSPVNCQPPEENVDTTFTISGKVIWGQPMTLAGSCSTTWRDPRSPASTTVTHDFTVEMRPCPKVDTTCFP